MSRNLFDELVEGFDALKQARDGKTTLRTHAVETSMDKSLELGADELIRVRKKLHLSQAIFAHYLKINKRTLENWEQGRTKPNAQAAVLIRLVDQYPDTLERIDSCS
ncbi:transcriptional regulator [Ectothiorhodospiraceae bacterium BW-2]|nr:transcriptional regulator [Ectothiorhodospiraceae bacterium BW-2]